MPTVSISQTSRVLPHCRDERLVAAFRFVGVENFTASSGGNFPRVSSSHCGAACRGCGEKWRRFAWSECFPTASADEEAAFFNRTGSARRWHSDSLSVFSISAVASAESPRATA